VLKTRIIPTLLWKGNGLVKGVSFDSWRSVGALLPAIKVYNTRDVDELILVDILASPSDREPDYESISEVSEECFVPLTVGGGIFHIDHVTRLLEAGADKICINSAAFDHLGLLTKTANRFGAQCVVASIDVRRLPDARYQCFSHCGQRGTGFHPADWAREVESRGAGEILLTSIDRDGTMSGYDLALIHLVSSAVEIPVIASGGAGSYEDLFRALVDGNASAVAAASMFHFTQQTPLGAKNYLAHKGIPVRSFHV